MLNDVTFGQYYPAKSFVHNMDPRAKIVLIIAFIVAIFLARNFFGLAAVFLVLVFLVLLSRVPFGRVLRSIKMILFVIVFGWELFMSPTSLGQRSAGMGIPLAIFYFLIPATFVLNLILAVTDILHYLTDEADQIDKEIDEREGFSV